MGLVRPNPRELTSQLRKTGYISRDVCVAVFWAEHVDYAGRRKLVSVGLRKRHIAASGRRPGLLIVANYHCRSFLRPPVFV